MGIANTASIASNDFLSIAPNQLRAMERPVASNPEHSRVLALIDPRALDDMQLLLCNELEALADSLPSGVNRQRCQYLAGAVYPLVASAHEIEEELLFSPLSSFADRVPDMPSTLARLRLEHHSDLCFAEELNDILLAFGRGDDLMTPNAVGYMLRAFFEGVRRHVAFEKEILVPLLLLVQPLSRSAS